MYMRNNPYQNQQWTNMQQQNTMPPGWEAKWDPGSSKWFYINHSTKTTQWDDPRQQTQNVYHGQQNNTTSFIEADPAKVKTLQSEYKNLPVDLARSLLRIHQNALTPARKNIEQKGYQKMLTPQSQHVNLLKQNYPTAPLDVIREVLTNTNNSVAGSRLALSAMGFKRGQETAKSTKPTTQPKSTPTKRTTPAKKATPVKTTTTTQMSDKVKKERVAEMKKKFPEVSETNIVLSLEGVFYDTEVATAILKSSIESVDSKKQKSSLDKSKDTLATTESYVPSPKSLEPVVFGAEEPKKKEKPVDTQKPSTSDSTLSSLLQPTTSQSYLTNRDKRNTTYRTVVKRVVPVKNKYTSSNRQRAVGPNPNLYNGPNPDLLIAKLIVPMGPNRAIRNGPLLENRCRPLPSNAVGPAGIAVGPAYARYETAC